MGMIDRYRKKGGFAQLLNLIETTGKDKQEKFLKMIADENAAWESEIRKRLLSMDKILGWNPTYLAEIFPRVPAVQMAMVVGGLPPEKAEMMNKVLGFKEKRQIDEILKDKKPTPGETTAGIMKLFAEIRKMELEGSLRFEKFDPEMVIPDDMEEKLGRGIAAFHTPAVDAAVAAMPMPSATGGGNLAPNVAEELSALRRKLVQLTHENQKLLQENSSMKDKLEQIKKIA